MKKHSWGSWLLAALLLAVGTSCQFLPAGATGLSASAVPLGSGIHYWVETTEQPRPLRLHILEIDLSASGLAIEARVSDDPDGAGPAAAVLAKPEALAALPGVVAAVNANAFGALHDADGKRPSGWWIDQPVEIVGWARHGGLDRSPPKAGYANFWLDAEGRARISAQAVVEGASEAVAGFSLALRQGEVLGREDGVLHPRTAVGVDAEGRRVWLVVADGRQKGVSEGLSTYELGGLLLRLGAWDGLNLDGGGSTVMLLAAANGGLAVVNRPSGMGLTRPVPVMLVVRRLAE